jgi:hypothetical protein
MTPQQSAIAMARLASHADGAYRFTYDTQGVFNVNNSVPERPADRPGSPRR